MLSTRLLEQNCGVLCLMMYVQLNDYQLKRSMNKSYDVVIFSKDIYSDFHLANKTWIWFTKSYLIFSWPFSSSHFLCQLCFLKYTVYHYLSSVCIMSFVACHRTFRSKNLCPRNCYFKWRNKAKSIDARSVLYGGLGCCKSWKYQLFHSSTSVIPIVNRCPIKKEHQKPF